MRQLRRVVTTTFSTQFQAVSSLTGWVWRHCGITPYTTSSESAQTWSVVYSSLRLLRIHRRKDRGRSKCYSRSSRLRMHTSLFNKACLSLLLEKPLALSSTQVMVPLISCQSAMVSPCLMRSRRWTSLEASWTIISRYSSMRPAKTSTQLMSRQLWRLSRNLSATLLKTTGLRSSQALTRTCNTLFQMGPKSPSQGRSECSAPSSSSDLT